NGVAVLEPHRGRLGKRRVEELERGLCLREMLDRRVDLTGFDVVEDVVAVREGAALGVLAGETDRDALDQQACERERFGLAPVDAALLEGLRAPIELLLQLRMDRELFGHGDERPVELAQPLGGYGSDDLGGGAV